MGYPDEYDLHFFCTDKSYILSMLKIYALEAKFYSTSKVSLKNFVMIKDKCKGKEIGGYDIDDHIYSMKWSFEKKVDVDFSKENIAKSISDNLEIEKNEKYKDINGDKNFVELKMDDMAF